MNRNDIDDTVRDMWATRPRRPDHDKKIAGVAVAIARRYQIDPTLVRVAFVVAAFYGGAGILLYLLGWLLLPGEHDEVSPAEAALGRGTSSMSTTLTVVLAIALIPASIAFFSEAPSVLVSVAVIGVGLYLLHRHRGGLGGAVAPTLATGAVPGTGSGMAAATATGGPAQAAPAGPAGAAPTRPTDAGGEPTVTMPRPTDQVPGMPPGQGQQPPAWDPLGVAPFAWDLPEPAQPAARPPAPRRRSVVTPVTIAVALVVAGVAAIAAMYDAYFDGPKVVAMVLAVIGIGLVIGSFVRGGRGLIPIAIPLAAITWGLAMIPDTTFASMGDRKITPASVADLQPRYEHGAGNIELDLTRLQLSDTDSVRTTVELGFGNMDVYVPDGADVIATCSSEFGNVECLGQNANGPNTSQTVTDYGDDGKGVGGTYYLELVNTGAGNIELKRR